MFRVFNLAWSNCRATKIFVGRWRKFLRKVKRGSTLSNNFGFVARSSSNSQLVLDPHQANQPISALHFFDPQQIFFARSRQEVDREGEKRETSTQSLQRNNVARQVEKFFIWYFSALNQVKTKKSQPWSRFGYPFFCYIRDSTSASSAVQSSRI